MTDLSNSTANGIDRDRSPKGEAPIADTASRPNATDAGAGERSLQETLAAALREAKTMFDAKSQTLIDQARESFRTAKVEAGKRSAQGVEMVRERPYAALGAAALAGFLLGHLISSGRSQVIYLRDDR